MNITTDTLHQAADEKTSKQIANAVAEVDAAQMDITRQLTPSQRFQQMLSMIDFAESVAAYRLRLRRPELSQAEALRIIRRRHVEF